MNERILRSLAVAGLALTAACSAARYSADFDPEADFPDYQSYGWLTPSEEERAALDGIDPFLERHLRRAVEAELSARGFQRSTDDEPDFLVSVHASLPSPGEGARAGAYGVRGTVGFGVGFGYPYRSYWRHRYPYFGYRYPYGYYDPYWIGFGAPLLGVWYLFPADTWRPGIGPTYYTAGGYGYSRRSVPKGHVAGTLVVDIIDAGSDELVWRGWGEGALLEVPETDDLPEYAKDVVGRIMKEFPPPAEGA